MSNIKFIFILYILYKIYKLKGAGFSYYSLIIESPILLVF